jgi:hypothetical protein
MTIYSRLALVLGLAFPCALVPGAANAQMAQMPTVSVSAAAAGEAYRESRFQAALTVEVLPLDAQVLLDGRPIGTGRELVAQAIAVAPGWHTVEVAAPGHYSYAGRFVADQHSSANTFVVTLPPIR